jgi:leader peptidase (prepilin peptidase) / N-methyltransferase
LLGIIVAFSALTGLVIGSFLNVIIYRVPAGMSVVSPPSSCPTCGIPVRPYDNVPVVSWIVLRGRCRACKTRISARYPIVELLTALLFGLIAARIGASWTLPAELGFTAGLISLAAIDLERFLLPRKIVYATGAVVTAGLVAAAGLQDRWAHLGVAVISAVSAFAVFFTIHAVSSAWMGFGDVRLAGLIGLALGWLGPWYLVVGFMAANLAGAFVGIAMMILGRASRRTPLPYGVFLAGGSVLAILIGSQVIHWYHQHFVR